MIFLKKNNLPWLENIFNHWRIFQSGVDWNKNPGVTNARSKVETFPKRGQVFLPSLGGRKITKIVSLVIFLFDCFLLSYAIEPVKFLSDSRDLEDNYHKTVTFFCFSNSSIRNEFFLNEANRFIESNPFNWQKWNNMKSVTIQEC